MTYKCDNCEVITKLREIKDAMRVASRDMSNLYYVLDFYGEIEGLLERWEEE